MTFILNLFLDQIVHMSKKNQKGNNLIQNLGPDSYIRKFGRSLSLEACYISEVWDCRYHRRSQQKKWQKGRRCLPA